ncbi:MAG TPA: hypothetical protein VKX17_24130 [Planctomycetota bacterium]|nr:hypothetical protein [Planctomycetota bacterium]
MFHRRLPLALFLLLALPCAAQSASEKEMEAKQADLEEQEARAKNPEAMYTEYAGKLVLFTKEQMQDYEDSGVIGSFATSKDIYLLKLESQKTLDDLKAWDGKSCTVNAKIRNNGKYIIVKNVVLSGAENTFVRRRGGM